MYTFQQKWQNNIKNINFKYSGFAYRYISLRIHCKCYCMSINQIRKNYYCLYSITKSFKYLDYLFKQKYCCTIVFILKIAFLFCVHVFQYLGFFAGYPLILLICELTIKCESNMKFPLSPSLLYLLPPFFWKIIKIFFKKPNKVYSRYKLSRASRLLQI